MESRLEEIEAKLSVTEDLLEELNKAVYQQQRPIDLLQHELTTLRHQLQTSLPAEPYSLRDEIPPHY